MKVMGGRRKFGERSAWTERGIVVRPMFCCELRMPVSECRCGGKCRKLDAFDPCGISLFATLPRGCSRFSPRRCSLEHQK